MLDAALAQREVRTADTLGRDRGIRAGDVEHFIPHVHADDAAGVADDLRSGQLQADAKR